MLEHFEDYNDIVGDHPQNLSATTLALNAYMLAHEERGIKEWLLEYVGAWVERTRANGGIIPTNIGLDGRIGGACDGKWYGGVYGWGFTVKVPQTGALAHRNTHHLGLIGFTNAFLLTGDEKYLDVWRTMIDTDQRPEEGRSTDATCTRRCTATDGWYAYRPQPYSSGASEIYYLTMKDDGSEKAFRPAAGTRFLEGKRPGLSGERSCEVTLETLRRKVRGDARATRRLRTPASPTIR